MCSKSGVARGGGNLAPFARLGYKVTGIDLSPDRIVEARRFFDTEGLKGDFIASNIFEVSDLGAPYDIIMVQDVIEHIAEKRDFVAHLRQFLLAKGVVFMGFPAWQMPFGGHQQICSSRICSHMPFIHLLPAGVYGAILRRCGESAACVDELLEIKSTGVSIEQFERLIHESAYEVADKQWWFINPHYEQKFGLKPRRLARLIGCIPYLRNYFCTSCFYLLKA